MRHCGARAPRISPRQHRRGRPAAIRVPDNRRPPRGKLTPLAQMAMVYLATDKPTRLFMAWLRLPAFIIGGAPRCATTWLYVLADRHPEIAMAKPMRPEPKFFLVDELYRQGIAYYATRWFADLRDARLLGEKSANYLENPVAAERIHAALPQVKLIFLL